MEKKGLSKKSKSLIVIILTILGSIITYFTGYLKENSYETSNYNSINRIALDEWMRNKHPNK